MARKKTSKKTATAELPKGFTAIGGFGKSWPNDDTEAGDAIQGVVIDYDSITVDRKRGKKIVKETVNNLKLETADGSVFTLWESAGLRALFEEDYTDVEVWIRFDGMGTAKRGQNAPKLYTLAYNE